LQLARYTCGAIVLVCATVVGFVVPFTLHPLAMPYAPLVSACCSAGRWGVSIPEGRNQH
jgi:hypothetical protein